MNLSIPGCRSQAQPGTAPPWEALPPVRLAIHKTPLCWPAWTSAQSWDDRAAMSRRSLAEVRSQAEPGNERCVAARRAADKPERRVTRARSSKARGPPRRRRSNSRRQAATVAPEPTPADKSPPASRLSFRSRAAASGSSRRRRSPPGVVLDSSNSPPPIPRSSELAARLERAPVATGLYEKEAHAMIGTWRSSWFGEEAPGCFILCPSRSPIRSSP